MSVFFDVCFFGDAILDRKMKWIVVSVLVAVIVGLAFAGYAQKQFSGVTAQTSGNDEDHEGNGPPNNRPPDNRPPNKTVVIVNEPDENKTLALIARFLRNTTAVSVNGTVIALINGTLLLRTDATQMSIILPGVWSFNYSIVSRHALFNGTFTGVGQNVTVHALKAVLFDASTFDVNVMFGYQIMNMNGTWAFAVLPFNIETKP